MTVPEQNHYDILELQQTASQADVRQAYLRLSLAHHPDKNKGVDEQRFCSIKDAYDILSDPQKRHTYDLLYNVHFRTPFTTRSPHSTYPQMGRSWPRHPWTTDYYGCKQDDAFLSELRRKEQLAREKEQEFRRKRDEAKRQADIKVEEEVRRSKERDAEKRSEQVAQKAREAQERRAKERLQSMKIEKLGEKLAQQTLLFEEARRAREAEEKAFEEARQKLWAIVKMIEEKREDLRILEEREAERRSKQATQKARERHEEATKGRQRFLDDMEYIDFENLSPRQANTVAIVMECFEEACLKNPGIWEGHLSGRKLFQKVRCSVDEG